MTDPELDFLGLAKVGPRPTVFFGTTEAAPGLIRGTTSSAINTMPDAHLLLDDSCVSGPIDYFAPLQVGARFDERVIPRFSGSVTTAEPTEEGIVVTALGGASMAETLLGRTAATRVPTAELVYLLARTGGVDDDHLNVQGLDDLPTEIFEVVTPIDGLHVEKPTTFAGARLLPRDHGVRVLAGLELDDELREPFDAPAYALALVTRRHMYSAEEDGLAEIDLALAWLTTRLRYGLARLPDGAPLSFSRSQSLHSVNRRDLVCVRGLSTRRQWLREPTSRTAVEMLSLGIGDPRLDPNLRPMTMPERQALLALRRAAMETDPIGCLLAVWEAVEFFCSGKKVAKLFAKDELAVLKELVPTSLTEGQTKKLVRTIETLNDPPLMARLQALIDEQGVPITDGEWRLLEALRKMRNDVVHGRDRTPPLPEHLDQAVSVVARLLVYAAERSA